MRVKTWKEMFVDLENLDRELLQEKDIFHYPAFNVIVNDEKRNMRKWMIPPKQVTLDFN
jgi:hypothetical protein